MKAMMSGVTVTRVGAMRMRVRVQMRMRMRMRMRMGVSEATGGSPRW